jgi:hypothetical protein
MMVFSANGGGREEADGEEKKKKKEEEENDGSGISSNIRSGEGKKSRRAQIVAQTRRQTKAPLLSQ